MNEPITLHEFAEDEFVLPHAHALALQAAADDHLTVLPGSTADSWRIKASSYVGTVVTPHVRVLVRPKVSDANLFHMLEPTGSPLALGQEVFEYMTTNDLMPSFATFFARHLDSAIGRGVHREYHEEHDRLVGLRGRADVPGQLRSAGLPLPVSCRYDEYTADTHLNRLLRAASVRLARLPGVAYATRAVLSSGIERLTEAGSLREGDLERPTAFTRLNEHFRPAEHLARLVVRGSTLVDSVGTAGASVFMVNMNKLFEDFVESRLRRYLAGELRVVGQRVNQLDDEMKVQIQPDLVFTDHNDVASYVGDTKYKLTNDGFARQADYYQLLAYSTALNLDRALLIYCQHDGLAPPQHVTVLHGGPRLSTWAVRLNGSPADVELQMRDLARFVADEVGTEGGRRSAA